MREWSYARHGNRHCCIPGAVCFDFELKFCNAAEGNKVDGPNPVSLATTA